MTGDSPFMCHFLSFVLTLLCVEFEICVMFYSVSEIFAFSVMCMLPTSISEGVLLFLSSHVIIVVAAAATTATTADIIATGTATDTATTIATYTATAYSAYDTVASPSTQTDGIFVTKCEKFSNLAAGSSNLVMPFCDFRGVYLPGGTLIK